MSFILRDNKKYIINQIINLIPSNTLKKSIIKSNHEFENLELVKIIIEFSSTWKEMISYLNILKEYINENNLVDYINAFLEYENKKYVLLVNNGSNYVYEVDMYPGSLGDKYLCPTFESTFSTIDSYKIAYKNFIDIRAKNEIIISKCRVFERKNSEDVDNNDEPVYAVLNYDKEIIRIYSELESPTFDSFSLSDKEILYPNTFKAGDLVYVDINKFPKFRMSYNCYYIEYENDKRFGINSFDNVKSDDICCFLDLSSEYVEYRKIEINKNGYCDYLMCHSHLDFGYLEKVNLDEVHQKIRDDYEYAKERLINLKYININN